MSITVEWYDQDHRILRHRYVGSWHWAELAETVTRTNQMIETVPHVVDVIADLTDAPIMPPNLFKHVNQILQIQMHERWGRSVIIGANEMQRSMNAVLQSVFPRLREFSIFVVDYEEALILIRRFQEERREPD